ANGDNAMTSFEDFRQDEDRWWLWDRVTAAVSVQIPKKYQQHLITLMRHFPQASQTSHIEATTAVLGLRSRCDPEHVPRLRRLMTVRSHGSMTYGLGARQLGMGLAVDIHLVVDLTKGQTHG